jgi:hypothetical protein
MENEQLLDSLPKEMRRLLITSKLERDFTYLQMEVITYADLWERAEVVVDFIERVWHTFEPFQVKLGASVWPRYDTRRSAVRSFGLKPMWKKWIETRRLLLDGQIAAVVMDDWESGHSHCLRFDSDVYLGVRLGRPWGQAQGHRVSERPLYDLREAKMLKLCINTRVWEDAVSVEVQEQIVRLACDVFRAVNGACGYVNVGNDYAVLEHRTTYEQRLGMNQLNTRRLCGEVRGAFWGNLLSARHVRALGGSQFVRQQAPCHEVISLVRQEGKASDDLPLYLQLTQTLETARSEDYARLESFLAPILISTRDQLGITILDPTLVASLGDADCLRQTLAESVRRAVLLPGGALLVEYDQPDGWPAAYRALQQIGCDTARGYRQIPQLRSMWWPDNAVVWTLTKLIPPRPRSGPIFPAVVVHPCIPGDALEFRVLFVDQPISDMEEQLRELVQEWSVLEYESESEEAMISHCLVPECEGEVIAWQADLAPVGQDAYIQLVMMLDEFSKETARLAEVHVGLWAR